MATTPPGEKLSGHADHRLLPQWITSKKSRMLDVSQTSGVYFSSHAAVLSVLLPPHKSKKGILL